MSGKRAAMYAWDQHGECERTTKARDGWCARHDSWLPEEETRCAFVHDLVNMMLGYAADQQRLGAERALSVVRDDLDAMREGRATAGTWDDALHFVRGYTSGGAILDRLDRSKREVSRG